MSIKKNIENLKIEINQIQNSSLDPKQDIQIIAVSKFQSAQKIEEAYYCGLRDFGENYIQEWQQKCKDLSHLKDIRWHLIGNLQKNKVKYLDSNLYCLQSVDSISLASALEKKWKEKNLLSVLIQIKLDENVNQKAGVALEKSSELCDFILKSHKLKLQGFMGLGPQNIENLKLKELYKNFVLHCNDIYSKKDKIISLGMSQDYKIALETGSNMIRIGTGIFGERPQTNLR